jgi:putative oxidoreductase
MYWVALVLQIVLGLAFLASSYPKVTRSKQMVEGFQKNHFPVWFLVLTGVLEIVAALGLIAGIWVPILATLGAALLICIMVGAVLTHMRAKDVISHIAPAAVLLLLGVVLLAIHHPLA